MNILNLVKKIFNKEDGYTNEQQETIDNIVETLVDNFDDDPRCVERYINEMKMREAEQNNPEVGKLLSQIMESAGFTEILEAYENGTLEQYYTELKKKSDVEFEDDEDEDNEEIIAHQVNLLYSYYEQDPNGVEQYKKTMIEQTKGNYEASKMLDEVFRRFEDRVNKK